MSIFQASLRSMLRYTPAPSPVNIVFSGVVMLSMILYTFLSLLSIGSPGLYMDGVNPDYDIVKLLNPSAPVSTWLPPGNLLFGRFPILAGPYNGSYVLYWVLPFYKIFGGTVLSIRVAHLTMGLVILACFALLCRTQIRNAVVASLAVVLLAIDPGFIFVFRTQAYIIMFPLIFLFIAIYLLDRYPSQRGYFVAGAFMGLAASGYFVFFFAWPGLLLFALIERSGPGKSRRIRALLLGSLIGLFPYFFGYGLMFATLGIDGGIAFLHNFFGSLSINSSHGGYLEKVGQTTHTIAMVVTNEWQWATFWNQGHDDGFQSWKALLLVLMPITGIVLLSRTQSSKRPFMLLLMCIVSYWLASSILGSRLAGHEFVMLIPMLYLLSAISIDSILAAVRFQYAKVLIAAAASVAIGVVMFGNASATATVADKLGKDGADGLFSDSISTFPETVLASKDRSPYIFWTWGEMMPFIYETGGTVPAYDSGQLLPAVCQFGKAKVVFLGSDAAQDTVKNLLPKDGLEITASELMHDSKSGFAYRIVSVKASKTVVGCSPADSVGVGFLKPKLLISTVGVKAGAKFSAIPNPVEMDDSGTLPSITVKWDVPNASAIEIHTGTASGTLFTIGAKDGSATTGAWVQAGLKLFLQDTSKGAPGKTVAEMLVAPCTRCDKTK